MTKKQQIAEIKRNHKRETMSKTKAIDWYGKEAIEALINGDCDGPAYKEGYRYCEHCERFFYADYHIDFISDSLTDDLDEAEAEGLEWACTFCKELAQVLSEPKADGSDVYLTLYPKYALRRLAEMQAQ